VAPLQNAQVTHVGVNSLGRTLRNDIAVARVLLSLSSLSTQVFCDDLPLRPFSMSPIRAYLYSHFQARFPLTTHNRLLLRRRIVSSSSQRQANHAGIDGKIEAAAKAQGLPFILHKLWPEEVQAFLTSHLNRPSFLHIIDRYSCTPSPSARARCQDSGEGSY